MAPAKQIAREHRRALLTFNQPCYQSGSSKLPFRCNVRQDFKAESKYGKSGPTQFA
ncbi:hypothetical protein CY34DRAFT_797503 [Suillus luteus UH-Slu-Lm8-n1]|uniref:Uncharacterized protein n=1 Tax=Suillus luteus UH-Slu-Lm8-n1 TaxID=930992 RepID=A0A0D0B4Y3_9AGAM|nr:hypothetical protein CY34DRAFT_797503 [Suillus luteus UH-Slu-Lm8-n1]